MKLENILSVSRPHVAWLVPEFVVGSIPRWMTEFRGNVCVYNTRSGSMYVTIRGYDLWTRRFIDISSLSVKNVKNDGAMGDRRNDKSSVVWNRGCLHLIGGISSNRGR